VAFSQGGRVLASTSSDKTIRLWSIEAALRGDNAWLATIVSGRNCWAAYAPDGRYKIGGESPSVIGFTVGFCRFAPGELDAYPEAFDHPPRRISEDEPLFTLDA
jgi:WD40 repeat protein